MSQLAGIFLNIMAPVFLLVLTGYLAGPRLQFDGRTLTRYAYFILTPAFVFTQLIENTLEAGLVLRMALYMTTVSLCSAAVGFVLARLLRRSASMTAAYVSIAVFGNVGNFGFPLITFAFGEEALGAATIYFLVVLVLSFIIGVAAASWERGGALRAGLEVLKTPGLMVVPVAILYNTLQLELPLVIIRPVGLLSDALIPTMLLALGVQLANTQIPRPNLDMVLASGVRMLVSPLLATGLAIPFGLAVAERELERNVGILQASMPVAVLVSIISVEYDMEPAFVTATVLFSTLASIVTLTTIIFLVTL